MKLWPSRSSTVVEASRTVRAGTLIPLLVDTECAGSSWLTFGLITMLIWPLLSTVGVKARPTPYFLYSIVTWPRLPGTGIGYSPPARKLAVSPDIATRLGCARLRTRPFCSSALISTSSGLEPPTSWPTRKPNGEAPDSTPAATTGETVVEEAATLAPAFVTGNCEAGT